MKTIRTSDGSTEPISLQLAQDQLRVDSDADQELVDMYIKAARHQFEQDTNSAISDSQEWKIYMDVWNGISIPIGIGPILTIDSVEYYDVNGDLQTLSASTYHKDMIGGCIVLKNGYDWPDLEEQHPSAIIVTFTAGYTDPLDVDSDIKEALLLLISHFYENRQAVVVGQTAHSLPLGYQRIIDRHINFYKR